MKLSTEHILPIIVLYRAHLHECPSYLTFLKNSLIQEFMVYDNSPKDFHVDTTSLDTRAVYQRDIHNGGLSKAYNTAAKYAEEKGYERILLLDQDSTVPPNALDSYLQADPSSPLWAPMMISGENTPFSPVCVNCFNLKARPTPPGYHALSVLNPVNSGMCIQIKAFVQAGGYNEKVKLDYADFEFCKRLRRYFPTFQLLPLTVQQDFSNDNPSPSALIFRHRLYLESAAECQHTTCLEWLRHQYQICKHTIALTIKTRSFRTISQYFRFFIFSRP